LQDKILEICEQERRSVEDGIASALVQANRRLDLITANQMARSRVDEIWKVKANRPNVVSGKDVLAKLSEWTHKEFGAAFGAPAVARQMTPTDIPPELADVIAAIEESSSFLSFEERQKLHGLGFSGTEIVGDAQASTAKIAVSASRKASGAKTQMKQN
jgi:hypothetical protein